MKNAALSTEKVLSLSLGDSPRLIELFGASDSNIKSIERGLNVELGHDRGSFIIRGLNENVDLAANLLRHLAAILELGGNIVSADIKRAADHLGRDNSVDLESLFCDSIPAVSERLHPIGNPLSARSIESKPATVQALTINPARLVVIRHSFFNQIPLLTVTATLWIAAIALSVYYPLLIQEILHLHVGDAIIPLQLSLFAIFPLLSLGTLLHRLFNERIILHPGYILFRKGLLSWQETSSRIEYENVREVNIGQNLIQKILGVGNIKVSTVATQIAAEVTMNGIRNPRKLKDEIFRRKHTAS